MASTVAHWHGVCIQSFDKLSRALRSADPHREQQMPLSSVFDEYGRFNVWAGNIGAGAAGRVSMDYRLREASHIKEQVIKLLQYLSETLEDAIAIVDGSRLPYEEMSSNSESESSEEEVNLPNIIKSSDFGHEQRLAHGESTQDSELQQLMQSVTKIVANLYKLSTIIRRGNLGHDRLLKSSKINVSYYEPFDIEHARNKFPSANDKLIYRMGQAISRRRQYLKYREQHHDKLSEPTIVPLTRQPVINTQTASKSDLGAHYKAQSHHNSQEQESTAQPVSVGVSTTASTFVLPKTPGPIDLDVDVYSESGTVSSYQSSAAGEEKLQFPPPPEASKDGQDFECPFCYTICRLNGKEEWQRKREWKRHMFKDLQPYMCTFDDCNKLETMFERRSDWFRHETQVHRKEWCCNSAGHEAFQNRSEFIRHMEQKHEESLDHTAQLPSIVSLFERPLESTTSSCPFCVAEDTQNLSAKRLERHLARHMEILALFAMPRSNDRDRRKSLDSGVTAEGSQESDSDIEPNLGEEIPLSAQPDEERSPTSNDFIGLEPYRRSHFDDLIRDFCAIEESVVPIGFGKRLHTYLAHLLEGKDRAHLLEGKNNTGLEEALIRRSLEVTERIPNASLKIVEVLSIIHRDLNSELLNYFSDAQHSQATVNHYIAFFIKSMRSCLPHASDDLSKLRVRLHDLQNKLRLALETESEESANVVTWDYVHPRVPIAMSIFTLLSRATAASREIRYCEKCQKSRKWGQSTAHSLFFQGLTIMAEFLSKSLKKTEFERVVATKLEYQIWSCEEDINVLKMIHPSVTVHEDWISDNLLSDAVANIHKNVLEAMSLVELESARYREAAENSEEVQELGLNAINNWLTDTDPTRHHQAAREKWLPGTSDWFFDDTRWVRYLAGELGILWVYGNSGWGKTVLCSAIVENLKDKIERGSGKLGLAYVYCQKDSRRTTVLRSVIAQLLLQIQSIPSRLMSLYSQHIASETEPSGTEFMEVLSDIADSFERTYIVIDGLDQDAGRTYLLALFKRFWKSASKWRVLILSKYDLTIQGGKWNVSKSTDYFVVKRIHVDHVSKCMIEQRLPIIRLGSTRVTKDLEDEMASALLGKYCGFLPWVDQQITRLEGCQTGSEIRKVLLTSPIRLDTVWSAGLVKTLEYGSNVDEFVSHLLHILCISARSLSFLELEQLYNFHLRTNPHFKSNANPVDLTQALEICSALVAFSFSPPSESHLFRPEIIGEIIALIHPSLREYLFSERIEDGPAHNFAISMAQANLYMAESCLSYLLQFAEPVAPNQEAFEKYPLLRYAAEFWHVHARQTEEAKLKDLIISLFTSHQCFANWLSVHDPDGSDSQGDDVEITSSNAAEGVNIDIKRGVKGRTIRFRRNDIGESGIELTTGKRKEHRRPRSQARRPPPLYYSALLGFHEVAKTLLARGARLDEADGRHHYPLLAAVESGNEVILSLFLQEKDNVERKFKNGDTGLIRAASQGKENIVRLLLEHGANTKARDKRQLTPLHRAAREGFAEIIMLLVSHIADVDARDSNGRTALYYAINNENSWISRYLINSGANIQDPDRFGRTLLHCATESSYLEGMQLLLDAGAAVDRENASGMTALHIASSVDSPAGAEILLEAGAHINALDHVRRTPLHHAAFAHAQDPREEDTEHSIQNDAASSQIVPLLLSAGADLTAEDDMGYTASRLVQRKTKIPLRVLQNVFEEADQALDVTEVGNERSLLEADAVGDQRGIETVTVTIGDAKKMRQSQEDSEGTETHTVSIPSNLVGYIIGRGGKKINELRKGSGAQISIAEAPYDGTEKRLLTIVGSAEASKKALRLLYNKLEAEKIRKGRHPESLFNHSHLVISDLGDEIDNELLYESFSVFGTVSEARIVRNEKTGLPLGLGFVAFMFHKEANKALSEMNGRMLGSRAIRCDWVGATLLSDHEAATAQAQPDMTALYEGVSRERQIQPLTEEESTLAEILKAIESMLNFQRSRLIDHPLEDPEERDFEYTEIKNIIKDILSSLKNVDARSAELRIWKERLIMKAQKCSEDLANLDQI